MNEADEADWRAMAVRTLKGASLEGLQHATVEGLAIYPLYAAAPALLYARRAFDEDRAWDVRVAVDHPDPIRANALTLEALEGGATSTSLRISDPADLEARLRGVILDLAPVALDAGAHGPAAAEALGVLAKASPRAPLDFGLDPVGATSPIEASAVVAARLAETYPLANLFRSSGRRVHEAGGGEALEIAVAAASGLAYARALARAGLGIERAFAGLTVEVTTDTDYFVSIAKLRAARAVFSRVAVACGAPATVRLAAVSSHRMLADKDAWSNMIRLTIAGFAAAAGGADVVTLGCFSDPLGRPAALARRQSRNIQFILMEEAQMGRVRDPGAGSGYVEALTDQLARAAWTHFQAIESRGGAAAASAYVAAQVDAANMARPTPRVVGMTDFVSADDTPIAVEADG
ncbi:methylmalonyl-CoA mutase family protein [Phenylobacterium immobile]|uniref:methylmalonyl-CoA mutase family protein n=1 Tax=Phenylobacterium immobile TaxID=21 RepID=UPI000AAF61B2|nr:methylmalonyl-CoA mutase family protein [Phenylobacterium immobile]